MTKEHKIHLTPLDFKTLAVLAQGDATGQELEARGVTNVYFRIGELNRKLGPHTVTPMTLQKGGNYRLNGQEYLDPDAIKIKKTAIERINPRGKSDKKSPFNPYSYGGSRSISSFRGTEKANPLTTNYAFHPEQNEVFPEDYTKSLPPSEREVLQFLYGTNYTKPFPATTSQSQVFELMISVGAHPPGHRIGRRENPNNGSTSYYLERLPNRPQNIRLQEG